MELTWKSKHCYPHKVISAVKSALKINLIIAALVLFPALVFAACGDNGVNGDNDATTTPDAFLGDAQVPNEAGSGDIMADIIVSGCERWETNDASESCIGTAPITLIFSSLSSDGVESFQWRFGDESDPSPTQLTEHTYQIPGSYDVTLLVSGDFGILEVKKSEFIVVEPAPLGLYCEEHENCETLHCHCQSELVESGILDCPMEMAGICTKPCLDTPCDTGVCVDLRLASSPDVTDASTWRQPLCLPSCTENHHCRRPGASCIEVPVFQHEQEIPLWEPACIPPVLRQTGEPCINDLGELDDDLCFGGTCLDIGTSGNCSMQCEAETCPSQSGCIKFNGMEDNFCVPVCKKDYPCMDDPLLNCETGDSTGFYGFTVISNNSPPEKHCAPKSCIYSSDCGWGGYCDMDLGGFCVSSD